MDIAKLNVVIGAEIDDFEREMKTLEKGIGRLGDKLQGAGEAMTKYVTLPLSLLAGASLKAAGDMQALEKGFRAVYKGAGDVGQELLKVQEIAELPGLGLKEALQGSINLQAAGFSADQAKKALTGFGNALATVGKGKADLEGVTTALSQMAAKGKLSAEDINQIAERVPQIRKVMQEAFGTSDTEALTKMGIGVEEFVSKVTDELNKLPKVSGGINNAFENMADKGLLALSTLGNAINTTFGVEGVLNSFADSLGGLANKFNDLDPATQKVILVFGGLAAAAGPLLLAIGGIVSALPLLISGFAVVTGPVGIAIAAIAAGAVLLITNWQAVTEYFKSSGLAAVFNEIGTSLQNTLGAILDYLKGFVPVAKLLWDSFLSVFTANIGAALKFVGQVLVSGLDILTQVLRTFGALFRGDWQGLWDGFRNIIAAAWNAIVNIVTAGASGILKILGGFAGALKLDTLKDSFNSGAAAVDRFGKSIQASYFGNKQLATSNKEVAESFKQVGEEALKTFDRIEKAKKEKTGKKDKALLDKSIYDSSIAGFGKELESSRTKGPNKNDPMAALPGLDGVLEAAKTKVTDTFSVLKGQVIEMTGFMQSALGNAFSSIGDLIGQAFSGGFGGANGFFNGLLAIVSDFTGQFGKLLIGAGVAALNFKNLLLNPVAAIAAGVALVAISGAIGGLMRKGPTSGGATGGGGSSYNAPTTRAKTENYVPGAVGGTVKFEIAGGVLEGVLRQNAYKNGR